ncbi:hypothetical protein [Lysobacter gummosus]|nr:hypothetical protein [Lysobacter gummosus]UJQ27772.1 hypothetical protein L2D09_20340 [Lysobacter gummosus]
MLVDQQDYVKVLIALASIALGWLLAQGTELVKSKFKARRIKKALLTELTDLRVHLERTRLSCMRGLQVFAIMGIQPAVTVKLSHRVFESQYVNAFVELTHAQRNSYELTHSMIDSVNSSIDGLIDFLEGVDMADLPPAKRDKAQLEKWGRLLKAHYLTIRSAQWHVEFHLANRRNPDLGLIDSPAHKLFVESDEQFREEIVRIIEKAKNFNISDFEKIRV